MSSLFSQSTIPSVLDFNISFKMWTASRWFRGFFGYKKDLLNVFIYITVSTSVHHRCFESTSFVHGETPSLLRLGTTFLYIYIHVDSVNYKNGCIFYLVRKKGSDHCRNHLHNPLTKVMYFFCSVAPFISHMCHQRKHFTFEIIQ